MPMRRFIKWTHDTFKAGGNKSELLPLLERCTRELQGVERYKDDARYLRVWIQYARPTTTSTLLAFSVVWENQGSMLKGELCQNACAAHLRVWYRSRWPATHCDTPPDPALTMQRCESL